MRKVEEDMDKASAVEHCKEIDQEIEIGSFAQQRHPDFGAW
jgi:hypothetical protein